RHHGFDDSKHVVGRNIRTGEDTSTVPVGEKSPPDATENRPQPHTPGLPLEIPRHRHGAKNGIRHAVQQRLLVGKMPIQRRRLNLQGGGEPPHREALQPNLIKQGQRRPYDHLLLNAHPGCHRLNSLTSLDHILHRKIRGEMILSNEFDVVVIGGGPVGLWLACELALAKVKVLVLERRAERVTQSRALTIHGRTLEVFALRGIAERFLSQGRPIPGFFFGGLDTLLDFSTLDSRFPFTLFLPQATTERLIEERALELGVDIRRGHLVEEVEQNAGSVIIRGRNGETPFGFAARYAVGADGARSIVRNALAIDFVGHPARHAMTLADVALDAPPEKPVLTLVNEAGGLVLAPRGDGVHHRIGVIDASSPYLAPSAPVSLAEVAACAARIFGRDLRPRDPVWISRFTDESRLAECYRK